MKQYFTTGKRNLADWVLLSSDAFDNWEKENIQLKQIVADLSLDKQMLQDVLIKKL